MKRDTRNLMFWLILLGGFNLGAAVMGDHSLAGIVIGSISVALGWGLLPEDDSKGGAS